MVESAVIEELFAVIRDESDDRSIHEAELFEEVQEGAEVTITGGDAGVVLVVDPRNMLRREDLGDVGHSEGRLQKLLAEDVVRELEAVLRESLWPLEAEPLDLLWVWLMRDVRVREVKVEEEAVLSVRSNPSETVRHDHLS